MNGSRKILVVIADILAWIISILLPEKLITRSRYFPLWERKGYHITPVHYYQPIPDPRELKDELWQRKSEMIGIEIHDEVQLNLLAHFVTSYKSEYDHFPKEKTSIPHQYYINNDAFLSVDAEILYCMIRYFKPERIYEIGSGFSTFIAAQSIIQNMRETSKECELIAFEPYPNLILQKGFPGLSQLINAPIQSVPILQFLKLTENDILFIDSSHVAKIGSDVVYEYLDIIPRLNNGVIVHFHDIFLPYDYPKDWTLYKHRFWNEQYLLQAFLAFNKKFEILWAGNYMSTRYPNRIAQSFSSYLPNKTLPGSLWIRKIS